MTTEKSFVFDEKDIRNVLELELGKRDLVDEIRSIVPILSPVDGKWTLRISFSEKQTN